jgi:8-amino-7-oxononanoate synthase
MLDWINDELCNLERDGLRRRRRTVTPLPDGRCEIDGRSLRNFASNDYLGLAGHPRVIDAACEAIAAAGVGSCASALVTGHTPWHERLEHRLAKFEQTEAALLFSTGYAANVGTLTALVGSDDVVFCDRANHASLVDGCRLSRATFRVFRHDELDRLDDDLAKHNDHRRRWIITDAVFSMDGDVAPLPAICDLAERHNAAVIVDEAHATGLLGSQGRGACELLDVEERVAVRIGTLSKALGTLGGFVSGSTALIEFLRNQARTQMFSTALPPGVCAAAIAAIDLVAEEPERRKTPLRHAARIREHLIARGWKTSGQSEVPIVPLILGEPELAIEVASNLEERGFLVAAIRPPTVPTGTSRLRITPTSAQTNDDINELLHALDEVIQSKPHPVTPSD